MLTQITEITFTVNLHFACQYIYKKSVCLSNRFFYYIIFDILTLGDKMEDDKLQELILNNSNLIYSIIHKFRSKDLEDLYQAGCIGLIKAYYKYNQDMPVKFTSYAYKFILGEIYQYIINNHSIHMSPANIKLYNSISKAREELTNYLGRNPSITELCNFIEIEPYKLEELENLMMIENIDDLYNVSKIDGLSKEDLIDLKSALSRLTEEEKLFIKRRYFDNVTQSNLAKLYNTNQVKISREEKKILTKLKAMY